MKRSTGKNLKKSYSTWDVSILIKSMPILWRISTIADVFHVGNLASILAIGLFAERCSMSCMVLFWIEHTDWQFHTTGQKALDIAVPWEGRPRPLRANHVCLLSGPPCTLM